MSSDNRSSGCLEDISRHFDLVKLSKRGIGPLAVRGLLGLSQAELGQLLGKYRWQQYRRGTITTWERPERGETLAERYSPSDKARECYRRLLADVVQLASGGRFELVAHMGKRVWHFKLTGRCRACGRPFHPNRRTDVHCRRHRRTHA